MENFLLYIQNWRVRAGGKTTWYISKLQAKVNLLVNEMPTTKNWIKRIPYRNVLSRQD
ncbi:hypothetical protein Fmac_015134 [Flemingia macrophylla]|uniref:Uncharacterized protein n=1 Tax=Flemingia macrophylla TaxID=520843 RepID=A0ABD1MDP9_9FABA